MRMRGSRGRRVELGDRLTTAGSVRDEPLSREPSQGFADGDHADAGSFGPRLLVHALARPELAFEDRSPQRRCGEPAR